MYRSEAASPDKWLDAGDRPETSPVSYSHDANNLPGLGTTQRPDRVSDSTDQGFPSAIFTMPSRGLSRKRGPSLIQESPRNEDWERFQRQQHENAARLEQSNLAARGLVLSLLENTGAHGIPNIKRAPNMFRKLAWTVLFIFGVSMFIWQTSWLLTRYYSFGVAIKMDVSRDRMVEFPAVTICNVNPIKSEYLDYLESSGVGLPDSFTYSTQGFHETTDTGFAEEFVIVDDAVNLIAGLRYSEREATGHLLEDMLLNCRFQGIPCNASDFTYFHHYLYGNCYIFNAAPIGNATDIRLFVTKAGPLYGLTLELYIEQDQYTDLIQQGAGARVVVHPRHNVPFPEDDGVSVSPGHETFVGFKRTNFTRLTKPYSNCTEKGNATIFNEILPYVRYSQRACEYDCYYQMVVEECGCSDPRYRFNDSLPLCLTDSQDICLLKVEDKYLDGKLSCPCTAPCRELTYDAVPGVALWPNSKFKPFLDQAFRDVSADLEQDLMRGSDPDFLEKNVLKINVYYDTLEYMSIYQDKDYDEIALLSDMGGNVGLWIGVSVLTVFEFLELIYDLCKLIAYKVMRGKKSKNGSKVTSSEVTLQHVSNMTVDQAFQNYEAT